VTVGFMAALYDLNFVLIDSRREEVVVSLSFIMRSFIVNARCCQEDEIEDDVCQAYGVNEEMRNAYRILFGKCEEKRPFGRRR
jgi:hypothetical protein